MEQPTIQTNIKQHTKDNITDYALFMGGTNVVNEVLQCYDPLRTGYGRLFMVRKPAFLADTIDSKLTKFKHILEYGNTQVQGLSDISVQFESITGGYVGKSFEVPTVAQDSMQSFTVQVYEFSGSPIREVLHSWINGTTDLLTGLTHYNGADDNIDRIQANNTAEFIYIATDNTGQKIEYACLLANCFPSGINLDVFNYTAGTHNLVQTEIEFRCTKYESLQINKVAAKLLSKYKILTNSLNFHSGFSSGDANLGYSSGFHYDYKTGKLVSGSTTDSVDKPVYSNDEDY